VNSCSGLFSTCVCNAPRLEGPCYH
jgi:hypothetical protein